MPSAATLHPPTPIVGRSASGDWAVRLRQRLSAEWAGLRRPTTEAAFASLRGQGHSRNQDSVLAAAPLYAVADGVGGGKAGELASTQMLDWCRRIGPEIWRHPQRLAQHLIGADLALAASLRALNTGGPSATTFAGAWLARNGRGHLAHVGDVRILGLRPDRHGVRVSALTQDQTYAAMGEAAPPGGNAGDPARMVGVGAIGQPPVQAVALRDGQMLLLCSDGFHRFVSPETLAGHVGQALRYDWPLARLAQRLAQLAQDEGSQDDVSVLLVRRNPRWGVRRGLWWTLAAALVLGLATASPWAALGEWVAATVESVRSAPAPASTQTTVPAPGTAPTPGATPASATASSTGQPVPGSAAASATAAPAPTSMTVASVPSRSIAGKLQPLPIQPLSIPPAGPAPGLSPAVPPSLPPSAPVLPRAGPNFAPAASAAGGASTPGRPSVLMTGPVPSAVAASAPVPASGTAGATRAVNPANTAKAAKLARPSKDKRAPAGTAASVPAAPGNRAPAEPAKLAPEPPAAPAAPATSAAEGRP